MDVIVLRKLLFSISSHLPIRIIAESYNDGTVRPYLERYFLFSFLGITGYLHRFVGSDPDRGLHDHPWPWAASFILSGSYVEEREDESKEVRWFNFLKGKDFHRVILPEGWKTVWTLFIHREKRIKTWGFLRPSGEVEEYKYTKPLTMWWERASKGREEPLRVPYYE